MLPFSVTRVPDHVGWKALGSVVVLGVVGTGFATVVVNRLIGTHGPARAMLVNYLIPAFALLYGIALLGEPLTAPEVAGFLLILAGVAFASGGVRLPRRTPATQPQ
jgi:drug/metabolite transporter (DMT)-like permease